MLEEGICFKVVEMLNEGKEDFNKVVQWQFGMNFVTMMINPRKTHSLKRHEVLHKYKPLKRWAEIRITGGQHTSNSSPNLPFQRILPFFFFLLATNDSGLNFVVIVKKG